MSKIVLGGQPFTFISQAETDRLLDAWVGAGGTMVDTARVYGAGKSDAAIGSWLRSRGGRNTTMILGKGGVERGERGIQVTKEAIDTQLEASLEALGTDYIDLYMLHRDDPTVPVGEVFDWLEEHRRAGRIRAFGGSNWTTERVGAANDYAASRGVEGFVAISNYFGLALANEPMWPGCILTSEEDKKWLVDNGIPNFAWSSLGRGFFDYRTEYFTQTDQAEMNRVYLNRTNVDRRDRAVMLGKRKGATATEIACAYANSQDFVSIAIVGPTTVDEVKSCIRAVDIELTRGEIRWLEQGE